MKFYRTLKVTNFPPGIIVMINDDQARRRSHVLEFVEEIDGGGIYKMTGSSQFKAGEVLGIEGDLNDRLYSQSLQEIDSDGEPIVPDGSDDTVDDSDGVKDNPGIDESEDIVDGSDDTTEADTVDDPDDADANGVPYNPDIHYANRRKDGHGLWLEKRV